MPQLVAAHVPREVADALRALADEGDRSLAAELRRAIRAHLTEVPENVESREANPGSRKTVDAGDRHAPR